MPITLNTASGGGVTLQGADTASSVTLTVPAANGVILYDGSDITSQVKSAVNASGSAPIYAARAWVNFNGTGTVAIRASGNVSSITDNGTGNYTVNFTTAMPDANYCVCFGTTTYSATSSPLSGIGIEGAFATGPTSKLTTSVRIKTGDTNTNTLRDTAEVNMAIFS